MSHRSTTSHGETPTRRVTRAAHAAIVLPLVVFSCLTSTACGGSSATSATAASAREVRAYNQQRAELLELVSCARRHGINLSGPTAQLKVSTRGVDLRSPRRKAALNDCFHKVVNRATRKAKREAQEQKEQESFGRRGGEEGFG